MYSCYVRYLHGNGETRSAKRWSGVHLGRRAKKGRRAAGKGEVDETVGNPNYWPGRSP